MLRIPTVIQMSYKGITQEKAKNPEFPSRQTRGKYELSVDEYGCVEM